MSFRDHCGYCHSNGADASTVFAARMSKAIGTSSILMTLVIVNNISLADPCYKATEFRFEYAIARKALRDRYSGPHEQPASL